MNAPSRSTQSVEPLAWVVVALIGILNLFRGSVHTFLPDGGAGVIAGFDLSHSRQTIVFLFAVSSLALLANLSWPVRLDLRVFLPSLALLIAYTLWWTIAFYRAFRLPPGETDKRA